MFLPPNSAGRPSKVHLRTTEWHRPLFWLRFFFPPVSSHRLARQGNEWVSTTTKSQYSESGQVWAPGWTGISWSRRLPCPPCGGVRPDRGQEVRGDSSRPVADNVSVPINTGRASGSSGPKELKQSVPSPLRRSLHFCVLGGRRCAALTCRWW